MLTQVGLLMMRTASTGAVRAETFPGRGQAAAAEWAIVMDQGRIENLSTIATAQSTMGGTHGRRVVLSGLVRVPPRWVRPCREPVLRYAATATVPWPQIVYGSHS